MSDIEKAKALAAQMMGFDTALTCLLETLARNQPATAKAVAQDIRARAAQLEKSPIAQELGATRKALEYAEIMEKILVQRPH